MVFFCRERKCAFGAKIPQSEIDLQVDSNKHIAEIPGAVLTETIQAENTNLTLFSLEKYEIGKINAIREARFKIQILESKIQILDLLTRKSRFWNLDLKSRLQIKIQILD